MDKTANYPVDLRHWTAKEKETYWRIRHAVVRRTDVLRPLLESNKATLHSVTAIHDRTKDAAKSLAAFLNDDKEKSVWAEYLQLDELANSTEPHQAAEETLLRLLSPSLTAQQQGFLNSRGFQDFEKHLRDSMAYGVTPDDIVNAIEQYEDKADTHFARTLLTSLQRFSNSSNTERYVPTIHAIDKHYRNANLRVSVSQDLINRFVPAMHQYAEKVNDTILGARVRGQNATWTNLSVQLIPDSTAIRLGLFARGQVRSNTASRKGPVVFYNRGNSQFAADKQLVISPDGIFLGRTQTRASTGNRVVGLKTDWDDVPFFSWIIRSIARQQHDEQKPLLRAEILRRVRRTASKKLDTEVQKRMWDAEQQLQAEVVDPLRNMRLDPRAVEMKTTNDRAILRTRLAGPLQLAAHTPRPMALRDSKMSIQIHQTAANNFLDHLNLQGRTLTLGQLADELSTRVGIELEVDERRRKTEVEFSQERPMEFNFQNGKVEITIHFARLDNGREQWKNFSVRGFYRADIRRMDVELIRDGSIELITETLRLRDQIALRSIFTKVFDTNHRFDLLRKAIEDQPQLRRLEVSHWTIRDGWISISIGENGSDSTPQMANSRKPVTQ